VTPSGPGALPGQDGGGEEEAGAIGYGEADEEVGDGGNREIHQDLHQGVHLVLAAHGADFEECEAAMHGEHKDCANQHKEYVGAGHHRGYGGRIKVSHGYFPLQAGAAYRAFEADFAAGLGC